MSVIEHEVVAEPGQAEYSGAQKLQSALRETAVIPEQEAMRPPGPEFKEFDLQAGFISRTVAKTPNRNEAMKQAYEVCVRTERDPELKRFGTLMVMAPHMANEADTVDRLR